jgi:large subunit ribosomal protein L19
MPVGCTSAICVHRLVAVICDPAVQNVFPALSLRQVADLFGCEKCGGANEVIDVEKVDVIRVGKVRRAKLYYLRDRVGKASKVKEQM